MPAIALVTDETGTPIEIGDRVYDRGGRREGLVDEIVVTESQIGGRAIVDLPSVLFTDQHGHVVAHSPDTLRVIT